MSVTAFPGMHAAGSPCPESQEQGFRLALGTVSSGSAVSIWHWPKEGSVTITAGTGEGTGGGEPSVAPPSRPGPSLVLSSLCALLH